MTRPRQVMLATIRGRVVSLSPVDNGAMTVADVRALVALATGEGRNTARGSIVGLSRLADVEALAEHRGVVVVRRSS